MSQLKAEPELIRKSPSILGEKPDPDDIRGICPECGTDIIACCYYCESRQAHLWTRECWNRVKNGTCDYRRVL